MMSSVTGETAKLVGRDFLKEEDSFPKLMIKLSHETPKSIICVIESGWKYN